MFAGSDGVEHERVVFFNDGRTGAVGVIAIHSTTLGPAMGGLRLRRYATLGDARADVLDLARAMSLKNAAAGLDLGGGKAVLIDDGGWAEPRARAERMRAVGRVVEELDGRYTTAEDVGTTAADMQVIRSATRWVTGLPVAFGGRGDPSPVTARTVFGAIVSGVRRRLDRSDLAGVRVGVQGVGHVGATLVALLAEAGAHVTLTDVDAGRATRVALARGARAVEPEDFAARELDVLAPCAFGGALTRANAGALRCAVVAGAANNQLEAPDVADRLADRDILYVPDFLANCGGIIHVAGEAQDLAEEGVERLVVEAMERTDTILDDARAASRTPVDLAVEQAQARIARGGRSS
jgi:glutamate dehydrogenase/leucine dehydrogenase